MAWLLAWLLVALAALAAAVVLAGPARAEHFPVPGAWVINLRRNRDRLASFERSFGASDLAAAVKLRRLDAVDGATLQFERYVHPDALAKLREMVRTGKRAGHEDLTPGAVGCYLSHLEVWRRIAESGAPYGLVFEDDAQVAKDAWARTEAAVRSAGGAWDILLLDYERNGPQAPAGPGLVNLRSFLRTHAYVVTARAARELSRSMLPIRRQLDWELSRRGLRLYGMDPPAATHRHMGTDIQSPLVE